MLTKLTKFTNRASLLRAQSYLRFTPLALSRLFVSSSALFAVHMVHKQSYQAHFFWPFSLNKNKLDFPTDQNDKLEFINRIEALKTMNLGNFKEGDNLNHGTIEVLYGAISLLLKEELYKSIWANREERFEYIIDGTNIGDNDDIGVKAIESGNFDDLLKMPPLELKITNKEKFEKYISIFRNGYFKPIVAKYSSKVDQILSHLGIKNEALAKRLKELAKHYFQGPNQTNDFSVYNPDSFAHNKNKEDISQAGFQYIANFHQKNAEFIANLAGK